MSTANGLRTVEIVVCFEEWNRCDRPEIGDVLASLPEDQIQREEKA